MDDIASSINVNLTETQFYNRVDEINILSNLLSTTQFNSAPTILLTGIRGVGKSALIKKLKNKFDKEYLVVDIDLSRSNAYQNKKLSRISIIKIIYDSIIESCQDLGLKTFDKKLEKYFKTNDLGVDKFFSYGNMSLPLIKTNEDYAKLANFVMELPQRIYDEYNDEINGVFIFIDEIQLIKDLGDELSGFLWYIRSFVQTQKNVAYLFSGSMSLKDSLINDLNGNNGAFGGRMLTIEIKPFSSETTKNYIKSMNRNILFDDNAFERFYKCTRGIPYYINILVKYLPENIVLRDCPLIKFDFFIFIN